MKSENSSKTLLTIFTALVDVGSEAHVESISIEHILVVLLVDERPNLFSATHVYFPTLSALKFFKTSWKFVLSLQKKRRN